MSTFSQYQSEVSSEKIGLVRLEAAKRLVGWELHSGSVYRLAFSFQAIVSIEDSGTALTAGASASLSAGQYYLDRLARYLYLRTSDSANPNGKFIGCTFTLFFSNANGGARAPHDPTDATSYEVLWLPYFLPGQGFKSELDNQNLLGFAIEGAGRFDFANDQAFWAPLFDKVYFENQKAECYAWNRALPITEAKILYRGKVQEKGYEPLKVFFKLKDLINELRAPVPVVDMSEYSGALIPPSLLTAKQRLLYGYVKGHVPTNIRQELELTGFTITGTAALTASSASVTGTGSAFLAQLTADDELLFGSDTTWYTVAAVSSDTGITLTEVYAGASVSGVAIRVRSSHPKRYMNRLHLIAGHALKEPATTISAIESLSKLDVADTTDFHEGDKVVINSELMTVDHVSGNRITLTAQLATSPPLGGSVVKLTVVNVYLNERALTYSRDYTYDAATALITLDQLAEFNVAPIRPITGTLAFTNASRSVTGTSTLFRSQVKPGDWVRRQGQASWFEVLKVDSDTTLTLRSNASYTSSGASEMKHPEVYADGDVVLSLDCLGATENGVKTGTFLKTGAQMVKDLLTRVGLEDSINDASFEVARADSEHKLGFAIPPKVDDTKVKSVRDVVNQINLSIFGSLFQSEDFAFEYSILSPKRPAGLLEVVERDILAGSMVVTADSSRISKTARVRYGSKEHDPASRTELVLDATKTSDAAQYLARTDKEYLVETLLVDETEAQMMANRWSFLMELASSVVKFRTKLQGVRAAVNDKVDLSHEKLYERVGTSARRKIAGVQSVEKNVGEAVIELSDLSNSFSRCAAIAPDDAAIYSEASEDEQLYNGYITDSYGMQDNDPETFGTNLIW